MNTGDEFTLRVGPRILPVTVRYADDDVVLTVDPEGRPEAFHRAVFERLTAEVIPPVEFWLDMRYNRDKNWWSGDATPLAEQPDFYQGRDEEGYAVKVRVLQVVSLPHVSQMRTEPVG